MNDEKQEVGIHLHGFDRVILDMIARWLEKRGLQVASQYVYDRLLRDSHDLQYARELLTRQQAEKEARG